MGGWRNTMRQEYQIKDEQGHKGKHWLTREALFLQLEGGRGH